MKKSIGFIGGGRVTKILLQAFRNKNASFSKIIVTDTNADVLNKLKSTYTEIELGDPGTAAAQDILFIALHPPVVMDILELVKGRVKNGAIVISLAPKINLVKLSSKLTQVKNIARLIPNATSYINEGYNPVTFSPGFEQSEKHETMDLLKNLGHTFEVSEEKLESYAIMSAMLPTYFWFQWQELLQIGQQIGLDLTECEESIYQTLQAALDLMFKSDLSPEQVIDLIPVKPISESEDQIKECFRSKLLPLFEKIKS